jgi:hypothetical protein
LRENVTIAQQIFLQWVAGQAKHFRRTTAVDYVKVAFSAALIGFPPPVPPQAGVLATALLCITIAVF